MLLVVILQIRKLNIRKARWCMVLNEQEAEVGSEPRLSELSTVLSAYLAGTE